MSMRLSEMTRWAMRGRSRTLKHIAELADAIRYALSRCKGLTRFLDDGRIELDNSPVEHSIRRQLKNALFAGSDGAAEQLR
jgi:transposase